MAVKRIVANLHVADYDAARAFYGGIRDMDVVTDHGRFVIMAGQELAHEPSLPRRRGIAGRERSCRLRAVVMVGYGRCQCNVAVPATRVKSCAVKIEEFPRGRIR